MSVLVQTMFGCDWCKQVLALDSSVQYDEKFVPPGWGYIWFASNTEDNPDSNLELPVDIKDHVQWLICTACRVKFNSLVDGLQQKPKLPNRRKISLAEEEAA